MLPKANPAIPNLYKNCLSNFFSDSSLFPKFGAYPILSNKWANSESFNFSLSKEIEASLLVKFT